MKVLIVGILVLALGVAAVSTYLIKSFRTPEAIEQLEKEKSVPKKSVLVATRNMTTGETVRGEDLVWQAWVDEALRPEYLVRLEGGQPDDERELMQPYIGALVRFPIASGEPVVADKLFRREDPGFLAGMLTPGMRAGTLRVSEENGAGGFVFPGDRVDVLLTHNLAAQTAGGQRQGRSEVEPASRDVLTWTTETILVNRRVLGIGQQVDGFETQAKVVPTVTLELTPREAQVLGVATSLGRLSLSLRPLADAAAAGDAEGDRSYTTDVEVSTFLSGQAAAKRDEEARRREEAAAALMKDDRPRASRPSAPAVTIFRGAAKATQEVGR
ncbi:MAG: Flp pilus assembly protein CpaB [Magnetospirillum sp. WYHS-4]